MPPKQLTGVTLCYQDGTKIKGIAELETITDFIEEHQEYVRVVRCKDCKHRPKGTGANHDLEFPDYVCPCQCTEDGWYSWKPKDDWFCADGERREE